MNILNRNVAYVPTFSKKEVKNLENALAGLGEQIHAQEGRLKKKETQGLIYRNGGWLRVNFDVPDDRISIDAGLLVFQVKMEIVLSNNPGFITANPYQSPKVNISKTTYVEMLTGLQLSFGYKPGEISTVALFGLLGEAGEVLKETGLKYPNEEQYINDAFREAISSAEKLDSFKKAIRKGDIAVTSYIEPQNLPKFQTELADQFYYLNINAMSANLTIEDLARISYEKVMAKQAGTGSSEAYQKDKNIIPHWMQKKADDLAKEIRTDDSADDTHTK